MEQSSQIISFCEELRKAREFQGLSLADVANETRIPLEYLSALESGQLSIIPEPIQRGVISAYAKSARMNSEKVLHSLDVLKGGKSVSDARLSASDRLSDESLTVGMTRAQIQTAWFASIAENRLLHWVLTLLLLIVGVWMTAQWRTDSSGSATDPVTGLSSSLPVSSFRPTPVQEIREMMPDSIRFIVSFPLQVSEFSALDTAQFQLWWGIQEDSSYFMYPHDKIEFMHYSGLRISSNSGAKGLMVSGEDTFTTHFGKDSLNTWLQFPDRTAADDALLAEPGDSITG